MPKRVTCRYDVAVLSSYSYLRTPSVTPSLYKESSNAASGSLGFQSFPSRQLSVASACFVPRSRDLYSRLSCKL